MIVTCPNCETKFEIPEDKYRPGRKARCSNCGFVFALPERDGTSPQVSPGLDAPSGNATESLASEFPFPASASVPDHTEPDPALSEDDFFEEAGVAEDSEDFASNPPPPASVEDAVLPSSPPAEKKRGGKKKKVFFGLGFALILAFLGYGGFMVYSAFFSSSEPVTPERSVDERLARSLGGRSGETNPEKEAARQAAVSRLALENVRQYRVLDNEKTGPMVVIEGSVVNNFSTPKDLILLEITIFDAKGNPVVLREQYCGVTLSLLQLRTLSKSALESALGNQVTILTNNTDIQPGMSVPFTAVFFDLPGSAYEFEVKILDVQEPAPKK